MKSKLLDSKQNNYGKSGQAFRKALILHHICRKMPQSLF